jgi:ribosomal protein L21
MKHAIVSLGRKQFNIQENDLIQVPGNTSLNPVVLFYTDGKTTQTGTPEIKDFHIKLDLVEEKMGKKVSVKRFKAKSRYKKNHGHRQGIMILKVVELGEAKKAEKVEKVEKVEKPETKTAAVSAKKAAPKAKTVKKTVKAEK